MTELPAWVHDKCIECDPFTTRDNQQAFMTFPDADKEIFESGRAEVLVVQDLEVGTVAAEVLVDTGHTGFFRTIYPGTSWEEVVAWARAVVAVGGFDI